MVREKNWSSAGFSLVDTLIALSLIGIIASFTMQKVLIAQANQKYRAMAQEAAAMIAEGYQKYLFDGGTVTTFTLNNLLPYLNYVRVDTTTPIDDWNTGYSWGCNTTVRCLVFHNGAKMTFNNTASFSGSSNLHYLGFQFDPDGTYSGSATGSGLNVKAVSLNLYANGFITSRGTLKANSIDRNGIVQQPYPPLDPSWFAWP
ncbi:MAG: type II secretion system protein [Vampirovibrionales bacterium]|nr:type II secretion system protein [Vampirovibrionales bacterium]